MIIETEKPIEQIEKLWGYLSKASKEELAQILEYWEKMKKRWEKKKKEFRSSHWWEDFKNILRYQWKFWWEIELQYDYLDDMSELEKEKFIEEYLYDDILYSWKPIEDEDPRKEYWYYAWKTWKDLLWWKRVLQEWFFLNFKNEHFWDEWAKVIAENLELKKWVELVLTSNGIWPGWAKAIAQNLKLKDWVVLSLHANPIWDKWVWYLSKMEMKEWVSLLLWGIRVWDEWIIELAKNLQLKEWVVLDLHVNNIWDKWAQALIDDLVLKGWVKLDLSYNSISKKMRDKLKKWAQDYNDKWLICEVLVD